MRTGHRVFFSQYTFTTKATHVLNFLGRREDTVLQVGLHVTEHGSLSVLWS